MELRHKLNLKYLFVAVYFACFAIYLAFGFGFVEATDYVIAGKVIIPSIGLESDVAALSLENGKLETPDTIVGSYNKYNNKTLLIGHSSTVFDSLNDVSGGDYVLYDNQTYQIISISLIKKDDISMNNLLRGSSRDTLILMTCAGEQVGEKDATHRLIVTAIRV